MHPSLKYIPEHERAALAPKYFAGPGRTFPIRPGHPEDVTNAARLVGHAADPTAVKANIIRIAHMLKFALPEEWETASNESDGDEDGKKSVDTLIAFGSTVKSVGGGKIEGHLVLFSDAKSPDLTGDYFTAKTDFDFDDGDARSGYYNHGLDIKIGNTKVGKGTLKIDGDVGVWLQGQVTLRDEYAAAVMKLVDDGELGLSSGALSHLVRRDKAVKGVTHVTHWPIGEWSLTPTPAEPRTQVQSIKSWAKALAMDAGLPGGYEYDPETERSRRTPRDTQKSMAMSALYSLSDTMHQAVSRHLASAAATKGMPQGCSPEAMKSIHEVLNEHADTAKTVLSALMGHASPETKSISTVREAEQYLRDAGLPNRKAVEFIATLKTLLRDAGGAIEQPPNITSDARLRDLNLLALSLT